MSTIVKIFVRKISPFLPTIVRNFVRFQTSKPRSYRFCHTQGAAYFPKILIIFFISSQRSSNITTRRHFPASLLTLLPLLSSLWLLGLLPLSRQPAAVNDQGRSGDVVGFAGRKKNNRRGDILGLADSPPRDLRHKLL